MFRKKYNIKKILFCVLLVVSIILFLLAIQSANKKQKPMTNVNNAKGIAPPKEENTYNNYTQEEINELENSVEEPTM